MYNIRKSMLNKTLVILTMAVLLACIAPLSQEAFAAESCTYLDYDNNGKATTKTVTNYTEITSTTTILANGWYVVSSNVNMTSRLQITGTDVRIIIKDGVTLNLASGIHHAGDTTLFLYGQKNGTGQLIAYGGTSNAGIGGNKGERGGTLNVHGVQVKAYGGSYAAGIGGGESGYAGAFYSYAGKTYAEGGAGNNSKGGGAGIGGGNGRGEGYHQIYGGEVEARGGRFAAGIGAAQGGKDGQLFIKNATVKAYGGYNAAGVGTGNNGTNGFYMFSMSGGTLYAEGNGGSAGIGGGPGSAGVRVMDISGGKITAVAGGNWGIAIGHGKEVSGNNNTADGGITLQADMMIKAGSSSSNAKVIKTNRTDDKVSACHSNKYVEISKCNHSSKGYAHTGSDTTHRWECNTCGKIGTENHRLGTNDKCVCGANISDVWAVKDGFYLIYNENHWNKMCDMVDNGHCDQKKFRLMNDISVSRPAGVNVTIEPRNTVMILVQHSFNGTFEGNGHTLNFNYTGSTPSGYLAPFMVTRSATISNLHVTGTIHNTYRGEGGASGLIGLSSYYGSTINNVRVSAKIIYDGKGNHIAGFIADGFKENSGWMDDYRGCVFDGDLDGGSYVLAGFHAKDVKARMTDCLFIPPKYIYNENGSRSFSLYEKKELTNCFYTQSLGNTQESGTKQVYSVKSGAKDLTIGYVGSPTVKYGTSRYTRYGSIIDYDGTCYAPQGTSVTLKITLSKPEYAKHITVNGSKADIKNNGNGTYTFTMPAKNTVIDIERPFSVRFLNADGSVLHTVEKYSGDSLSANDYPAKNPVKEPEGEQVKYSFIGWKYNGGDVPSVVTKAIDIKPAFEASYRVNFLRDDGTLLGQAFYPEGTKVSEIEFPSNPTKDSTMDAAGHYRYEFDSWDSSPDVVTAETDYTAHFRTIESEHDWVFSFDFSADHNWLTAKAVCRVDAARPHRESERVPAHCEPDWDGANPCVDRGKSKYSVTMEDFSKDGFFYNILPPTSYYSEWSLKYDVDPLGHDWIVDDGTDEEGWHKWTTGDIIHAKRECGRCGEVEEREIEVDHVHGVGATARVSETEPTCTKPGNIEYVVCSCGIPIKQEGDEWVPMSDEELTILALGHVEKAPVKENEEEPTCTTSGSYEEVVYCERCDEVVSCEYVPVDPLGHQWSNPQYTYAWEEGTVNANRVCEHDAEHVESETAGVSESITKEPTCEETGSKYYHAEFNNDAFERQESDPVQIDALGHDWDDGEITQEATCTNVGIRTFTCSRCGNTTEEELPLLDHVPYVVLDEESNTATCTEAGTQLQHELCAVCGETLSTIEISTDPLGHLFWDLTYEWSDDMSQVTAKHVCQRVECDETESETVESTSTVTKESGCETTGTVIYSAQFENVAFEPQEQELEIEALGHDWGDWTVTREPTETAEGEKTHTCNRCGKEETQAVPKLDPSDSGDSGNSEGSDDSGNPDKVSYSNTEGNGIEWVKGSTSPAVFTFKRSSNDSTTFSHFVGIQVDGKPVDRANYDAEPGSVVVSLKPAYLETLALGEHTITALFDDGNNPSAKFTIVAAKTPSDNSTPSKTASPTGETGSAATKAGPYTGDGNNPVLWILIMEAALVGLLLSIVFRRVHTCYNASIVR